MNPTGFERIAPGLYRRGTLIYARVRENGTRTWRGTGTNDLTTARKLLKKWREEQVLKAHGIETQEGALNRNRLTVAKVVEAYAAAGCPTKKLQSKAPATVRHELRLLNPVRRYFGDRAAVTVKVGDCDEYRAWRNTGGYKITRIRKDGKPTAMKARGGDRGVDLELTYLSNAFKLAVRRGELKANPLAGRTAYSVAENVRHCREVAPTPEGLAQITGHLRQSPEPAVADLVEFLAYSGLRIGEALPLTWAAVNLGEGLVQVNREKHGCNPWVAITPELETLLRGMQGRAKNSPLLFPSPHEPSKPNEPSKPRDHSAVRRRITSAIAALNKKAEQEGKTKLGHVTPHGLRSYFVTSARQSGLTDAEIAMLIGDKTGPSIIASTYGDLRDDHLLAQARRVRHTIAPSSEADSRIPAGIPTRPQESPRTHTSPFVAKAA